MGEEAVFMFKVCDPMSREEEVICFKRLRDIEGDKDKEAERARIVDHIVRSNARYVLSIANELLSRGDYPLREIAAEGLIGLYESLEKFDVAKGNRFITFARRAIVWRILNYFEDGLLIKLPKNHHRIAREMNKDTSRSYTIEEVSVYTQKKSMLSDANSAEVSGEQDHIGVQEDLQNIAHRYLTSDQFRVLNWFYGIQGEGKIETIDDLTSMMVAKLKREALNKLSRSPLLKRHMMEIVNRRLSPATPMS